MYILEMANNHMGSVSHAKKIIDRFAHIVHKHNLNAAIKLQFRQLDSFIHKDFIESDLKYVKRFKETRLSKAEFKEAYESGNSEKMLAANETILNSSVDLKSANEKINYYNWVGFYFSNFENKTLELKAFTGSQTEHEVIPFGKRGLW